MEYNELYHHGITGMKWGVRRFQNPDGSLKPAGEKRYGSGKTLGQRVKEYKVAKTRKKNLQKARDAREAKKKAEAERLKTAEERAKLIKAGKIKIKDMTDEEIAARTQRLNNEKYLRQLEKDTEVVSAGKAFVNTLSKQVLKPAAIDAGRNTLTKFLNMKGDDFLKDLKEAAGLKDPAKQTEKRLAKLTQEYNELATKAKIKELKEANSENNQTLTKLTQEYNNLAMQKKIEELKNPKMSSSDRVKELENISKLMRLEDVGYQNAKKMAEMTEYLNKIKNSNYKMDEDFLNRDKNNNGMDDKKEKDD